MTKKFKPISFEDEDYVMEPIKKKLTGSKSVRKVPLRRNRIESSDEEVVPCKTQNSMKTPRKPRRVPNKLLIKKPNCLNLNASDDGLVDMSTPKNFTRSSAKLLTEILHASMP